MYDIIQTIFDTLKPVVSCPVDSTVQCVGDIPASYATLQAFIAAGGLATDNHSIAEHSFRVEESGIGTFCDSTIIRNYFIQDISGNENFCSQTISVKDTIAPTFTRPADITLCRTTPTTFDAGVPIAGDVVNEDDNCDKNLEALWVDIDATNTDNDDRVVIRQWTLTDNCGNSTLDTQKITIKPAISALNSTFTCPDTVRITLNYGACDTIPTLGDPLFKTDITAYNSLEYDITNKALVRYTAGSHTVIWTVKDPCGFTLTCEQAVIVNYPPCGYDSLANRMYYATIDGYDYPTVRVGCNCWTAENLHNTHYMDNTEIVQSTYYNRDTNLLNEYGRLYSWYATVRADFAGNLAVTADGYVQGICPLGWAIPTVSDYQQLLADAPGAAMLKSSKPQYWLGQNGGQTPNSGFNALPGGYYDNSTYRYYNLLGEAYFWTSDSNGNSYQAIDFLLSYYCLEMILQDSFKGLGFSVRCIKNNHGVIRTSLPAFILSLFCEKVLIF